MSWIQWITLPCVVCFISISSAQEKNPFQRQYHCLRAPPGSDKRMPVSALATFRKVNPCPRCIPPGARPRWAAKSVQSNFFTSVIWMLMEGLWALTRCNALLQFAKEMRLTKIRCSSLSLPPRQLVLKVGTRRYLYQAHMSLPTWQATAAEDKFCEVILPKNPNNSWRAVALSRAISLCGMFGGGT